MPFFVSQKYLDQLEIRARRFYDENVELKGQVLELEMKMTSARRLTAINRSIARLVNVVQSRIDAAGHFMEDLDPEKPEAKEGDPIPGSRQAETEIAWHLRAHRRAAGGER